ELIYFPKLMSVRPTERRLVRVGLKAPTGAAERSYRLFLDELPDAARPADSGLSFTIRFALPIFLPATEAHPRGAIESLVLERGKLRVGDRKSTRLNSSHRTISYAVF